MSPRLRWGILGTGVIAHVFTNDLRKADFNVVAAGSRDIGKANAFAERFGIARTHASYASLIGDAEVDVIYVATPHPMHAANAIAAIEGGKHVLVEKPFTLNRAEAEAVAQAARQHSRIVFEAMWTRWLPHMAEIRRLIASGTIGEPRALIADHGQRLSDDPAHRLQDPALGGGALLDLGVYPVAFAHDLFGQPTSVSAISMPTATGVDRQTAMVLGHAGGSQSLLHALLDGPGPCRATVIGTDGRIEIDAIWYNATSFSVVGRHDEQIARFENTVSGRGMQYQAAALEAAILGESDDGELEIARAIGVMATLDAVRDRIGLAYPGERRAGSDR